MTVGGIFLVSLCGALILLMAFIVMPDEKNRAGVRAHMDERVRALIARLRALRWPLVWRSTLRSALAIEQVTHRESLRLEATRHAEIVTRLQTDLHMLEHDLAPKLDAIASVTRHFPSDRPMTFRIVIDIHEYTIHALLEHGADEKGAMLRYLCERWAREIANAVAAANRYRPTQYAQRGSEH